MGYLLPKIDSFLDLQEEEKKKEKKEDLFGLV